MNLLAGLGSVGKGISQGAEDWRRQDEADARKKAAQRDETTFNNQQDALKRDGSLRDALSKPDADVPAVLKAAGKHSEALQYETNQRSAESGKMDFAEKQYGAKVKEKMRSIYGDYTSATSPVDENDPASMEKRAAGFKNTIEGAGELLTKLGGPYKGFTYHGINAQGTAVVFSNPNGDRGEVPVTPDLVKQAMQLRIDAADPEAAHTRAAAIANKKAEKDLDTQSKIAQAEGTGEKAKNVADAGLKNAETEYTRKWKGRDEKDKEGTTAEIKNARVFFPELYEKNPASALSSFRDLISGERDASAIRMKLNAIYSDNMKGGWPKEAGKTTQERDAFLEKRVAYFSGKTEPGAQPAQVVPPPEKREIGKAYQTPKGMLIWRGNGWSAN